ncbi:GEX Interacting protein [Ditylenchus destructor]|nr:GEX Interacting protein [Ditylenchus destructor]
MHPKPECSKCGLPDFASLDDLETHIVSQHFRDFDAFYKCLYPKCWSRFPTEIACLKHELDVHLRRYFVRQRLAIHECLNQSINVTGIFSGHAEPNVTNSESLTTNDAEGKKHTNIQDKASSSRTNNLDSVIPTSDSVMPTILYGKKSESLTTNDDEGKKSTNLQDRATPRISKTIILDSVIESVARRTNSISSCGEKAGDKHLKALGYKKKYGAWIPCAEKVGAKLVNVSVTAGPALSNNESIGKNNETIEHETSSRPFEIKEEPLPLVKEEPSLFDELDETIPVSSNHSGCLNIGNTGLERTEHENSVVKDEPSLIDELAAMIPGPSNLDDHLIRANSESAAASSQPKRSRIEILPENSSGASVIKDEPSLMDELAETIPVTSDHSDTLTPALQRRSQQKGNDMPDPETKSGRSLIKNNWQQPKAGTVPVSSNYYDYLTQKAKNAKRTLERYHSLTPEEKKVYNAKRNLYSNISNRSGISNPRKPRKLVYQKAEKVGARLVNVSVTAGPALSNNESIGKNNETIEPVTSSSLPLVKDEPSLMDELTETIPGPSDHSDYLNIGNAGKLTPTLERRLQRQQRAGTVSSNYLTDYLTQKAKNAKRTLERYHSLTPEEKKVYNAKRNLYNKRKQREKEMAELEAILRESGDICGDISADILTPNDET